MLSDYEEEEKEEDKEEGDDDDNDDNNAGDDEDNDDDKKVEQVAWMNTDIKPPEIDIETLEFKTYLFIQYRTCASKYVDVS